MLFYGIFGLCIFACAYEDYKHRRVPDILAVLFLCFFTVYTILHNDVAFVFLAGFSALYTITTILKCIEPQQVLGWMDIVLTPICFAFFWAYFGLLPALGFTGLAIGISAITQAIAYLGVMETDLLVQLPKRGQPLMVYLCISYIVSLLYWVILN